MFGLIMAMTVIGAARVALLSGDEEVTGRVIISAALGCNIAWGLVDAIMYVFTELFDRGKYLGLVAKIKNCKDEETAIPIINKEIDSIILDSLSDDERKRVCSDVFKSVSRIEPKAARVTRDDIMGAIVCFLFTFATAFITVVPFYIRPWSLMIKMWLSRGISFAMLFGIGYVYGKYTNRSKIKTAIGMVVIGLVINIVILLLGG